MTTPAAHQHRYRLPEPDGPTAVGTCACGATTRPLGNSVEEIDWLKDHHTTLGAHWSNRQGRLCVDCGQPLRWYKSVRCRRCAARVNAMKVVTQ